MHRISVYKCSESMETKLNFLRGFLNFKIFDGFKQVIKTKVSRTVTIISSGVSEMNLVHKNSVLQIFKYQMQEFHLKL